MHRYEMRKYPAVIFIIFIFFSLIASTCFAYDFAGGTGKPNDPYQIETAEQLLQIDSDMNLLDKCYILNNDIDLDPDVTGIPAFTKATIAPNASVSDYFQGTPFTGTFDGNGCVISNLNIDTLSDLDPDNDDACYLGLFGRIDSGGKVINLALRKVRITTGDDSKSVGSLIGYNKSNIDNCHSSGIVTGGSSYISGFCGYNDNGNITNCYAGGIVEADSSSGFIGGICGYNKGNITDSYSKVLSVSGYDYVGGLCGENCGNITNSHASSRISGGIYSEYLGGLCGRSSGCITNCYATGNVTAKGIFAYSYYLGGLCGRSSSNITNCYATGNVTGYDSLGGLCGRNDGNITNCFATGNVDGDYNLGGLCGNNSANINSCYASGNVNGGYQLGGLCGKSSGDITNCYSTGCIVGSSIIGGLCGYNCGYITDCYSIGTVTAHPSSIYVGGLCGSHENPYSFPFPFPLRMINYCFWDIETSGSEIGVGYIKPGEAIIYGKTTEQMHTASNFIKARWDFVGETVNGIDDIWFIPHQDYPHLWWEGMQVPMKLTPRTLNCRSQGNWVKAHLTLPEGFTIADVDANRPAVVHSYGFESAPLYVFVNESELVEIEAAFQREAVCSLAGDWPEVLTVYAFFSDGSIFYGRSGVRMITPGLNEIEELALYWLNADCGSPEWCGGMDLNRDSIVNFRDYSLLLNSQVEFVSE